MRAILPPPVRPGDRIGVAALSGPIVPERLDRGLAALAALGYEPVPAANLGASTGLFAGTDDERLAGFHELAGDPSLAAIVFARGGAGMLRVLPRIDWRLLARRPRAYVGYSDVTPFLAEVVRRLGLVAFHGPMAAADFARGMSAEETESFVATLAGEPPAVLPVGEWLRAGEAEGPLAGGCLTLLAATLGTPFAPAFAGSILFWEEVAEPLYRIDRMLGQLALAGALDGVRGMVVGDCRPADADEAALPAWREHLEELVAPYGWPVATGLPAGHRSPNWTVPVGLPARLDPAAGGVVLLRP